MAIYYSDGKKLVDVEYDTIVEVGDIVDGMRVLSTNIKSSDEYAVFLLEPNTRVTCYVFDEVFIVGKMDGFENLADAVAAWNNDEI
ncbi:hypothetical protein [Sulfurimonas sp.]|uniref:hypothetical protein n=1 Tax=Sulfurimonas sp. TaxID=2022749 RepID=UPI003D0B2678